MTVGCVPTAPILEIANSRIAQQHDLRPGDQGFYRYLARRCNLKEDSLANSLQKDEIEFDLADLILCRLGVPMLWRQAPLDELYETVSLDGPRLCRLPGCSEPLPNTQPTTRYCSIKHKSAYRRQRAAA